MKSTIRPILLTAISSAVLYACGSSGSSASDGGLTQPQVQALIDQAVAPLQQQLTTLQTQVSGMQSAPAVFIRAPNAPAVKSAYQGRTSVKAATASTCTGLGTLTGRPENSDPIASNDLSGVSCTGYYFTVSGAATSAQTAVVQPLSGTLTVWYDAPNCKGNAYVSLNSGNQSISAGAVANGAVFRIPTSPDDPTNAATYWMLKPATAVSDPAVMSAYENGQCSPASGSWDMYQLAPNDQTVSGVPSAPIPGPITIG